MTEKHEHRHHTAKQAAGPESEAIHTPHLVDESSPADPANQSAQERHTDQMITISLEEFDALNSELEKSGTQLQETLEGWQRERADFTNYRKRMEKDYEQRRIELTASVIKRYLVIADDLERALKARPTQGEGATWAAGMDLIYRKLTTILEAEGVKPIQENQEFDPTIHEAISNEDSPDHHCGQIIEVIQQGYRIGDRVLRPALVRVAR